MAVSLGSTPLLAHEHDWPQNRWLFGHVWRLRCLRLWIDGHRGKVQEAFHTTSQRRVQAPPRNPPKGPQIACFTSRYGTILFVIHMLRFVTFLIRFVIFWIRFVHAYRLIFWQHWKTNCQRFGILWRATSCRAGLCNKFAFMARSVHTTCCTLNVNISSSKAACGPPKPWWPPSSKTTTFILLPRPGGLTRAQTNGYLRVDNPTWWTVSVLLTPTWHSSALPSLYSARRITDHSSSP